MGDDPGVTAHSSRPDPPTPRPLSNWTIAAGALLVLAVAAVVWFALLRLYGGQGAQIQLDAIRTAGTLVLGTGGAVALLLTARRQRYTELALVHTDRDATERRITELYTKAADQLGSEKAPVRLAGLHALERLAQNTPEQRQTIVDVICAYLRMPYTPPEEQPPTEDAPTEAHTRHENRRQEQQVRRTAENVLFRNLSSIVVQRRRWRHRTPPPAVPNWSGICLDLTGASLLKFSLPHCQLDYADLTSAQFTNNASFLITEFTGGASFAHAQFTGEAFFVGAQFADWADFEGAQFKDRTEFGDVQFANGASFVRAEFTGEAFFLGAHFKDRADFEGARVASAAEPGSIWPPGWTTRPAKPDNGEDPAFRYLTEVEDGKPSYT